MTLMTLPISMLETPSFATLAFVASATLTADDATRAASLAFFAISRIEAVISSVPVATVCTLRLTCSAAALTMFACDDVSVALLPIWELTAFNSSDELASAFAFCAIADMAVLIAVSALFTDSLNWPSSSADDDSSRCVKSPSATRDSASEAKRNGCATHLVTMALAPVAMLRLTTKTTASSVRLRAYSDVASTASACAPAALKSGRAPKASRAGA